MGDILRKIRSVGDLKSLDILEMNLLSKEIRNFLIENISKTGGHLASNLGVVELTLALHKVFDSPYDKIIWDVGHQSYVHKIITGRKDEFHTLRQYKGLSGFPKKNESHHDVFETGHSSTSISAGLGYALARDLKGESNEVISVIGDGAMTAGMAFEALNHIGDLGIKQIVVLNDNEMSISENVGGLSKYLNNIRTTQAYYKVKEDVENILTKIPGIGNIMFKTAERAKDSVKYFFIPGMLFEDLGFKYLGPIDGHNIKDLIYAFNKAKKIYEPTLIHVITKKGKGYIPAENDPDRFHSAKPFKIETGEAIRKSKGLSYSNILGESLTKLAKENEKIVAITAAMPSGTGLCKFKRTFPKRFFDVGIAEQHGVTLAAGMAADGLKPFFAVYSTFLQRGYDQVLHDVCIQNLPVVFALDRAGLVGSDGETHHGVFDLSYLTHIPNISVMAPKDRLEFEEMLKFASEYTNGPLAIRYPKGETCDLSNISNNYDIEIGSSELIHEGSDVAIFAVGEMVEYAVKVMNKLREHNMKITLVNARFVKPLDENLILKLARNHNLFVTYENNSLIGGYGSLINDFLINIDYKGDILNIGIPDKFIEHGSVDLLFEQYNMDVESVTNRILSKYAK